MVKVKNDIEIITGSAETLRKREILNSVADKILDLDNKKVVTYNLNYDDYLNKNNIEINTKINKNMIYEFDRQGGVREKFELQNACSNIWEMIGRANKYIDETAPWTLAKEGKTEELKTVMYHLLESLRVIANLVSPYLVESAPKMMKSLGLGEVEKFDILNLEY